MSRIKSHIFDSLVGDIEDGIASQQIEYDQLLGKDDGNKESVPGNQRGCYRIGSNGHCEELKEPDAGIQF